MALPPGITRRAAAALVVGGALCFAVACGSPEATPRGGAPSPSAFRFRFDPAVRTEIDVREVLQGVLGPPRDGIPAIRHPTSVAADRAPWWRDDDPVVGVVRGDAARAYPVRMLDAHEVVNDRLHREPLAVTYCPLCDVATVFSRDVPDPAGGVPRLATFGVSGFLHRSDVLLYDSATESFWQQMLARAVMGPLTGTTLPQVPCVRTTWGRWRARHPTTTVLSPDTEYGWQPSRYDAPAYVEYRASDGTMFPAKPSSDALPTKAKVLGVAEGNRFFAIRADEIDALVEPRELDAGVLRLRIEPDAALGGATVSAREAAASDAPWRPVATLPCYWFAWYAFHPTTEILSLLGAPAREASKPDPGR